MTVLHRLSIVVAAVLLTATRAPAQTPATPSPAPETDLKSDTDPIRPVLISIRPEFYNIGAPITQAALIFRYDMATLTERRWLPGKRGVILRVEVPFSEVHIADTSRKAGLGDAYSQILLAPYLTRKAAFVVGAGLRIPTASDNLLGGGKWVVAPAMGPVWFFQGRGLFFVKFQNLTSVAGDSSRPNLNALLITPSFVHTLPGRWWLLADSETTTDWKAAGRTGIKSGIQLGRGVAHRFGVWAKPERWWGANQAGSWNLKFGFVWYR